MWTPEWIENGSQRRPGCPSGSLQVPMGLKCWGVYRLGRSTDLLWFARLPHGVCTQLATVSNNPDLLCAILCRMRMKIPAKRMVESKVVKVSGDTLGQSLPLPLNQRLE